MCLPRWSALGSKSRRPSRPCERRRMEVEDDIVSPWRNSNSNNWCCPAGLSLRNALGRDPRAPAREDEQRRRAVSLDDEHAPHRQRDSNSNSNVPCWREPGPLDGSRRWWVRAGSVNGDGDDARRLSVVQPRCCNNSNNSGHEPGKVVANDTTTTTEDDCRPAAPRWTAGVPTGHPALTHMRRMC